ncbi:unnamed protein product [Ranitomeya imitator]|uniref:Cadherin domain-containing protein n=1 Tax=Ranitomeya imitator TaxID=111125 RepID=A0ABN9LGG5_9NEOB|nr:unnamed protein product [Ranitomeya imitator]
MEENPIRSGTTLLKVIVVDANDNAPIFMQNMYKVNLKENIPINSTVIILNATDNDEGINAKRSHILLLKHLETSTIQEYSALTQQLIEDLLLFPVHEFSPLDVSDVNDNPPIFSKSTYVAYVPENNLPGASIFSIQASDPDTGDNARIIYSISSTVTETPSMTSYLSINIETGVLYAQRSFDYEQNKEFIIEVTASDNGSPSLSSNVTLFIHIVDQNDNAPKILYPSPDIGGPAVFEMVPFIFEPGSLITKVVAVDADSGHNSWLSYHFISVSDQNHFVISEHSGEIRTSRTFQEKDMLNYKIVVMVKDNGHPTLSATTTLSFIIADDFQQIVPKLSNKLKDEETQSNLQFYLVVGLALISLLFIITVLAVIISKCKQPKPLPAFSSLTTNLYPPIDPRTFSMYSDGSLPLPYSYNMCVALDPAEGDFTYLNPNGNVPVENLIDAENTEQGAKPFEEACPSVKQETSVLMELALGPYMLNDC